MTATKDYPTNNEELRQMAQEALDNWLFNEDDPQIDPEGRIKRGLEYLASDGDYIPDEDIFELFERYNQDKWRTLEEIALNAG